MVTSNCGIELSYYIQTTTLYPGNTYNISNSPYTIEIISQYCDAIDIGDNYSIMRVKKNGTQIGENTYYVNPDKGNIYSYDNNNLCIDLWWFDCSAANPSNYYTTYDIWYNVTPEPSHLECVSNVCTRVTGTGTDTCTTEGSTTECVTPNYTHILEIRVRPWGWYSPDGAASKLLTKLYDIDGWCINLVSSLSEWQYVETIIIPDGQDVLIQSRFKNLTLSPSMNTMAVQGAAIIAKIVLVISILLVIIGTVGLITIWKFFESSSDPTTSPTYEPEPKDILPNIVTVINDQTNTCLTDLPLNPTCANVNTYATCLKAAHIGVYGTLKSVKPNFQKFQDTYNKYLDIYTNLAATCNEAVIGKTPSDILNDINNIQQEYIEDTNDDFNELQEIYDEERCWIPNPFGGCLISDSAKNTILTIGGLLIGGYVALKIVSSKK